MRVSARWMSSSWRTTFSLLSSNASFLASRDRVKGQSECTRRLRRNSGASARRSGRGDGLGALGVPPGVVAAARLWATCLLAGAARTLAGRGALARLAIGPALELRATALGERHVDRVEVARRLAAREDRARFVAQLRAAVAAGHMRQREQAHVGVARELGRLARGAVRGLARAIELVV